MNLKEKTILVTGSTDGVGRRVAQRMARSSAMVLIHGRSRARADSLLSEIRESGGAGIFYHADFSSLSEVRELVEAIHRDHGHLDVLINNAGIGMGGPDSQRRVSRDGHELRFAVNYLSGFLLTRLLLPLLKKGQRSRIINVASVGQQPIDFTDVMLTKGYSGTRAYCQSKLAQIMSGFDLAHELDGSGVAVNSLHPATYMDTAMVRTDGIAPISTLDEGADAIVTVRHKPASRCSAYTGQRRSAAVPAGFGIIRPTGFRHISATAVSA